MPREKIPYIHTIRGRMIEVDSAAKPPVLKVVRIRLGSDFSAAGASFSIKAALRS
jgi:hypothetical protein